MSSSFRQIELADTGRLTTQLGYGGSGLMGGITEWESLRLLEIAYDAGIRHFDVAPSYGHGAAERCLGKFLRGKQDHVTVTTKYGIEPPPPSSTLNLARTLLRPVVRATAQSLPGLRQRVANAAAHLKTRSSFSVEQAQLSLDRSRRALGLDRIDLWLLHEVTAADLADNALTDFLQDQVQLGRIATFGVGSTVTAIPDMWQQHRATCQVLQFEWPGLQEEEASYPGAFLIHYRVMEGHASRLSAFLSRNPSLRQQWSQALDLDLSTRENISALLLTTARVFHPDRIILFSSRHPDHLLANARAVHQESWHRRAERFRALALHPDLNF